MNTLTDASPRRRILLLGDTRIVGHHGSSSVVKVILRELALRGADVMSSGAAGFRYNLADAGPVDCIVMNAEGALHGRNPNALGIARIALEARREGIPCFILNAVVDECHADVVEGLRAATSLFCREHRSYRRALDYGAQAVLCPDLTFALDLPEGLSWTPGDRVIVTDSTLEAANGSLHAFARRTHAQFLPLRGRPEVPLFSSRKAFIRIAKFETRHALGKLAPGSFATDRFGCAASTAPEFLRALVNGSRLVIAGRFHGVCLCMKLGAPFVAIRSNTYKIEGLLEDAGLAHKLVDLDMLASAEISAFLAMNEWTAQDTAATDAYVSAARGSIAACFDSIAESGRQLRVLP